MLNPIKVKTLEKTSFSDIKAMSHINEEFSHTFTDAQFSAAQKLDCVLSEVGNWLENGVSDNLQLAD